MALVAVVVVALCAAGLIAVVVTDSDDGDDARPSGTAPGTDEVVEDLVVLSTGLDHGRLYLVRQGQPIGDAPSFGQGRVMPIGRMPHVEAPVPVGGPEREPGLVPVPGGAIVAWRSGGRVLVARVGLGDGGTDLLYTGSQTAGVGVDEVDGRPRLLIEGGGDCLVSEGGRPAEVLASGPTSCRFEPGGKMITGRPVDGDDQAFTLLDRTGQKLTAIEPAGQSAELHGGVVAVRSEDAVAFADATTGEALHEYGNLPMDGAGTTPSDGGVLVMTGTEGDFEATSLGIDLVTGSGDVEQVAEGVEVAARIGPDGTVLAAESDWTTRRLVATGPDGGAAVPLAAAPGLEFEVVPGAEDATRVLAWSRDGRVWLGPATRPLPAVGTVDGGIRGMHQISSVDGDPGVFAWLESGELVRIDDDGVVVFPETWSNIEPMDASERGVLVAASTYGGSGQDDDDRVLLLVSGDDAKELARGVVQDARFDGDDVVYEWRAPKAPVRDAQIRRLSVEGEPDPQVIQDGVGIALPWTPHPVWQAASENGWRSVYGCASMPTITPSGDGYGTLDESPFGCVLAPAEPGVLQLAIDAIDATHLAIESGGEVVAEIDGPLRGREVTVRTEGGPVVLRFTPGPPAPNGLPQAWGVVSSFEADP